MPIITLLCVFTNSSFFPVRHLRAIQTCRSAKTKMRALNIGCSHTIPNFWGLLKTKDDEGTE